MIIRYTPDINEGMESKIVVLEAMLHIDKIWRQVSNIYRQLLRGLCLYCTRIENVTSSLISETDDNRDYSNEDITTIHNL